MRRVVADVGGKLLTATREAPPAPSRLDAPRHRTERRETTIADAAIDMWALSRCGVLIGTPSSSFSTAAARLQRNGGTFEMLGADPARYHRTNYSRIGTNRMA